MSLAHGLAHFHQANVLLIDLDAQGHCATSLAMDPEPGVFTLLVANQPMNNVIRVTKRPGLHLLPGNSRSESAAHMLHIEHREITEVAQMLVTTPQPYDYIVVDTPPRGYLQEVGVIMADTLVVPSALDYLAIDGIRSVLTAADQLAQRYDRAPNQRIILPMFADRTRENRYNLDTLQENFGEAVASPVPRRVKMREAVSYGQTIWEYAPEDASAAAYRELINWVVLGSSRRGESWLSDSAAMPLGRKSPAKPPP